MNEISIGWRLRASLCFAGLPFFLFSPSGTSFAPSCHGIPLSRQYLNSRKINLHEYLNLPELIQFKFCEIQYKMTKRTEKNFKLNSIKPRYLKGSFKKFKGLSGFQLMSFCQKLTHYPKPPKIYPNNPIKNLKKESIL
ncbi:hypothetical protein BpHYR1_041506 [Brachionus plicatilis]|uniref:Uncharacterized protein n=1 Tax=Brachionus plicatilis TaxID=10195 RepID=A0A3M7T0A3_BRAPC|nr:hypothetical protein BpHYR1_041506 [Brachionus plicatilis]